MSTRMERVAVFQDTMEWIQTNPDLRASLKWAVNHTEIFYEGENPPLLSSPISRCRVTVSGDRSFQAAMRLHRENPSSKIAVLNFANAFHPGGGVLYGSSAQEECLCRCSTLYPLLNRKVLKEGFYDYHSRIGSPIATDSLIYTEGVVICKTDEDHPKRMEEKDWVLVDVITAAAPDLHHYDLDLDMDDYKLYDCHKKRIRHILTVAAAKGADTLVLGAFGCGAFCNDPKVVAMAFRDVLKEFSSAFQRVEFAVYTTYDRTNEMVFRRVFRQ